MKKVLPAAPGDMPGLAISQPAPPQTKPYMSLRAWSVLLAACWVAVALLLLIPSLWLVPSFLASAAPRLYAVATGWLPGWLLAPRTADGPGRVIPNVLYVLAVTATWAAYLGAVRALRREPEIEESKQSFAPIIYVMGGTLLFGLLAVFWAGLFTSDPFLYAAQGKMQVLYGLNPVTQPPTLMGDDPLFQLTPWKDIISAYGPVWLMVAWAAGAVGLGLGGSNVVYVLEFRALNLGVLLLCAWLLWLIGGQLGWHERRRAAAVALFAWCPLVILELVGNAHNDALLVLFLLLGVWLHLRGMWPLAIAALVAGGLVKITGFFLLPAYLVLLLAAAGNKREAGRRIAISAAVGAGCVLLAYLPYGYRDIISSLLNNPMKGFVTQSPAQSFREVYIDAAMALRGVFTSPDLSRRQALETVRMLAWWGPFLAWGLVFIWLSLRPRTFAGLLHTWGWVLLSYMLLGAVWFQPWYATWLLPVVALSQGKHLQRAALLLAYGCTIAYSVIPHIPLDKPPDVYAYYVPAVIFVPALAYLLWAVRQEVYNRRAGV